AGSSSSGPGGARSRCSRPCSTPRRRTTSRRAATTRPSRRTGSRSVRSSRPSLRPGSGGLDRRRPPPDLAPEQVAVRGEEAGGEQGRRRQRPIGPRGERGRHPERRCHQEEREARPEPEPRRGAEEEREEEQVGEAEARLSVLPGDRETERERRDSLRVLEDPRGRPPEDRVGVDPRDQSGDERDPARTLEDGEEDEGDRCRRSELGEAGEAVDARVLEGGGGGGERERDRGELGERRPPERE